MKKHQNFSLVFILSILFLLFSPLAAFAEGGYKIAIVNFEPGDTNASPKKITYKIKSELIKTGKFDVISSKKVKKALDELEIPDEGIINDKDAVKLGKKLNADVVLMGEVTNFDVSKSTVTPNVYISRVRVGRMYSVTVKLDISARLIHTASGAVIFSDSFSSTSHRESHDVSYRYVNLDLGDPDSNSMTKKVFNECMDKLVNKIKEMTPKVGYVLSVEDSKIILDMGKNREMKEGTLLDIIELKEYKHPGTGKLITSKEKKGKVKVVKVLDNVSHAELIEGKIEDIKAGNMVMVVK